MLWFTDEWGFRAGDYVRVYVRYGGSGGFSLGLSKTRPPRQAVAQFTADHITFYVDADDEWYFEGRDLEIDYLPNEDDIEYRLR